MRFSYVYTAPVLGTELLADVEPYEMPPVALDSPVAPTVNVPFETATEEPNLSLASEFRAFKKPLSDQELDGE